MKRIITLCLALLMLIALFAGCGSSGTPAATEAPPAEEPAAPAAEPAAPPAAEPAGPPAAEPAGPPAAEPAGPPEGPPAEEPAGPPAEAGSDPGMGAYTLPLTDEDITLVVFEGVNPQMLQFIDNIDDLPINEEWERRTGVQLEHMAVNPSNENEQFQIMVAGGEMADLITQVTYKYPGGIKPALDDEVVLELSQYSDLMPNYMALIDSDADIKRTGVLEDGRIGQFSCRRRGVTQLNQARHDARSS